MIIGLEKMLLANKFAFGYKIRTAIITGEK